MTPVLSRRDFVAGSSGFVLSFAVGVAVPARAAADISPNIWVTVSPDDSITIVAAGVEMGQGIMTGMPMIVAEEMDADWAKVKVVPAPSAPAFGNPYFGGVQMYAASQTTNQYFTPLRIAGAQARRVLLDAVAAAWSVPVGELETEPSRVVHRPSQRRISYGGIAKFAKAPAVLPKLTAADLKKPAQFRLIGTSVPRVELPKKTTGDAKYGMDSELAGMIHGAVLRPPVPGSAIQTVDDSAARAVRGVIDVIPLPWGVGVVGSGYEVVHRGKAALKVTWKEGAPAQGYDSEQLLKEYSAIVSNLDKSGLELTQQGDVEAAAATAARAFSAVYLSDHCYHATMEPMNALARVGADGASCEIWASTQAPGLNQLAAAAVLETTPDKIVVHTMLLGCGLGRRLEQDFVLDAVLLSKRMGKPVKVVWSREDDVKNDTMRPLAAVFLQATVDADGKLSSWRHRLVAASALARLLPPVYAQLQGRDEIVSEGHTIPYACPNQRHELFREDRGYGVGPLRGVGSGYNKFANESFIDEIAAALKIDPLEFRMNLLADNPRVQNVLKEAARMADWGRRRPGRGLGIGFSDYSGTCIASVAEVSVNRATGQIRVHDVWAAVDPGLVINPANVMAQVEGGTVMGTSLALRERIAIADGVVQQSNFHDYPILRMAEAPDVHVKVIASDHPPTGVGECGVPPMGAAIANAVAALTGVRLRRLPLLPERVLAGMAAADKTAG